MKREHRIPVAICVVLTICCVWMHWKPAPLDPSNDGEPFRSMVMPPKLVRGVPYLSGSVTVLVTDQSGDEYPITFPFDHGGVRNPYPTAFLGDINGPMVSLKNPERAKEIAIRLLRDHAKFEPAPVECEVDGQSGDSMVLRALSNPPDVMAIRATDRIRDIFD